MSNPIDRAQAFYAAALQGQLESIPRLLHDEFEFHPMQGFPFSRVYKGWQAVVQEFFPQLLNSFSSWAAVPTEIFSAESDRIVVLGHYEAGIQETQEVARIPFLHLWTVRDDRLFIARSFTDTVLVRQALERSTHHNA